MMKTDQPHVAIIGAGPAGLAAAECLAEVGCSVTVFDKMPSAGRKLLMAGRSGLNLTNAEPLGDAPNEGFLARYGDAARWLEPAIAAFPPEALIAWAQALGEDCFKGSSGRVFPRSMKASPLLRAWLRRLGAQGVQIRTGWNWTGWDAEGALTFAATSVPNGVDNASTITVPVNATVLALGGASWRRLGSDGAWTDRLAARDVDIVPFRPANCGFRVAWSAPFAERFQGAPLKRIAITVADTRLKGEAVVTARGIEGGLVYALSARLRDAIALQGAVTIELDLRPDQDIGALAEALSRVRGRESLSNRLRKAARLPPVAAGLLREAGDVPQDALRLAQRLKAVPVTLVATDDPDRAISVAGGVCKDALDSHLMLRAMPGVFACGEMLDWEAPTGGYLLQAVMATGRAAGIGAVSWLRESGELRG